ncbi:putative dioxygenase [Gordonia hirsuta DSM 44140 = NBRC 16056]|uniref:Putative dioxygenase n=1 Tax=Gordonia hirsuta DSM 44140 = NBRC 16056 TaxID=1121927 RepID=L7L7L0_9ACTN|nr:dioxygenase [Gordonia hirsuta]GAC57140.1 putative dioxygenase [Gordonia hirsuta DSM 44140 = NBRC 16056]
MIRSPEPEQSPQGPTYEGRPLARPDDEVVDQGAGFDVATLLTRRRMLAFLGAGAGTLALAACSDGSSSKSSSASTGASEAIDAATEEIPEETNGPYPADGSNNVNILQESGIERSDITTSLDGGNRADGVPLTFTFKVTDMANANKPFTGAVVYLWQCDAQGRYSMYSEGVENETFLRGIQKVGRDGNARFTTIVPGCYTGRWTHLHFEVYPDLASATDVKNAIATSQVAFPHKMLNDVYRRTEYSGSAKALAQIGRIENDNVFGDGYSLQMGTFTGDPDTGYRGSLAAAVDINTEPAARPAGPDGPGGPGGSPGGQPPRRN